MPRKGWIKPQPEAHARRVQTKLTARGGAHLVACVEASTARTEAEYVRRLIMGERIPARLANTLETEALVRALQQVGIDLKPQRASLNQLAKSVNSGQSINPSGFQQVIDRQAELIDQFEAVLRKLVLGR